jgi:hypothetical protein
MSECYSHGRSSPCPECKADRDQELRDAQKQAYKEGKPIPRNHALDEALNNLGTRR